MLEETYSGKLLCCFSFAESIIHLVGPIGHFSLIGHGSQQWKILVYHTFGVNMTIFRLLLSQCPACDVKLYLEIQYAEVKPYKIYNEANTKMLLIKSNSVSLI